MIELRPGRNCWKMRTSSMTRARGSANPGCSLRTRIFVYPTYRGFPGDFHEMGIGSIDYLYPFNVFRILPPGIAIVLKSGETLRFAVFRRDRLMAVIRGAVADLANK